MCTDNSILINGISYCITRKFNNKESLEDIVENLLRLEINGENYFTDQTFCDIISHE